MTTASEQRSASLSASARLKNIVRPIWRRISRVAAELQSSAQDTQLDLSNCRCPHCTSRELRVEGALKDHLEQPDLIACGACGKRYDVLYGIPYLLSFGPSDFLTLVEIAAEFDSTVYNLDRAYPLDDRWPKLLAKRHNAADVDAFMAELDVGLQHEMEHRYPQFQEMEILTPHIDLRGKNVLVVGAGLGFDTHLLIHRGARVTAIDLNPHTMAFGRKQTPGSRWIAALGRRLPFVDEAFDHVFISASLHHVKDVTATIIDMLRVTKPGGSVVTTNDSYAADAMTDQEEVMKWNSHGDVLRGINENTPCLKVYIDPLLERLCELDVELWTSRAFSVYFDPSESRQDILKPQKWDIARDHEMLRTSNGALFMRITKRPTKDLIRPHELLSFVGRKAEAMATFGSMIPTHLAPEPFPGAPGNTKFQVLNGWRSRAHDEPGREAYLLGRWFMDNQAHAKSLLVVLQTSRSSTETTPFEIAVNAIVVAEARVGAEETEIRADVTKFAGASVLTVEIRMRAEPASFSDALFRVIRLELSGA